MPLAFVAGLLTLVLLQVTGLIKLSADNQKVVAHEQPADRVTAVLSDASVRAPGNAAMDQLQARLRMLQEDVDFATQEREEIFMQIDTLKQSVAAQDIDEPFLPGQEPVTISANEADAAGQSRRGMGGFGRPDSNQQYQGLLAAGVDPVLAENIKQRNDQWALARLDLLDTAEREGWRGSEEFGAKMRDLREQRVDLREELGDLPYDNYLYLSGENNRVRVDSTITGSVAQQSGLQQGDLILSYAGNRIFTHWQLQGATRDGLRGETVSLAVQRGGQYLNFDIPRGPLGVSLSGIRVDPAQ